MNIPTKTTETFQSNINRFFSSFFTLRIHKVFNFALYQQGVNNKR